jgi:anti-sigma B factor antagonist
MTVLKLCSKRPIIVRVEGLRVPVSRALGREVRALLRCGARAIVVDLAEVSRIDAAGVGELVRAFNMTAAVDGALRIDNASAWVRQILELTGLFDLLSGEEQVEHGNARTRFEMVFDPGTVRRFKSNIEHDMVTSRPRVRDCVS